MEIIEIFDLDGNHLRYQDRESFYTEIKKEFATSGAIKKKIRTFRLLLMTSTGEIIIQKRSQDRKENAGLFDKSVGGHILGGETWDSAVSRESLEEIGVPAVILDRTVFDKLSTEIDLTKMAVISQVGIIDNYILKRVNADGSVFYQPFINATYIGYYDGKFKSLDGECEEVKIISADDLKKQIRRSPKEYTGDLAFMVKEYNKYLHPLTMSIHV